jgi:hypothetical protein
MEFKQFLEVQEHIMKDVKDTLRKIPKKHAALVKGWKFDFQDGNGVKGDYEHIGWMDRAKKTITVAAPWNYGRQYAFLHEVGHLVWETFVTKEMRKEWGKILKNTKAPRQHQSEEEMFCMAYGATYAKNVPSIHDHETWKEFIRKLPK